MQVKKFICGLCKPNERTARVRKDLRNHLRQEHRILRNLANRTRLAKGSRDTTQDWWIVSDVEIDVKGGIAKDKWI